jgi:hypothetical protein
MKNRASKWLLILAVAGGSTLPSAQAADYGIQLKESQTKHQRPEDAIDMIPFLGSIPKSFLVGDGYKMRLTAKELRIDHMGNRSASPAHRRNCMVGISYSTPVAGFFSSRIDIPFMSADKPAIENWTRNSLGDYVIFLSRQPVDKAAVRLIATARF